MQKKILLLLVAVMCISLCACGGNESASGDNENSTSTEVSVNGESDSETSTEEEIDYIVGEWESENSKIVFHNDNTCEYEGLIYEWELVGKVFLEYELSIDGNVGYIFMENTTGEYFNLFTVQTHERTGEITTDHIVASFTRVSVNEE